MAGSPRLNSITYGGLKVGEGTSYHLHGPHLIGQDYDTLRLSFEVVVQAATEAALLSLTSALESAYRTKNSDLLVVLNSQNFINTTHAGNTGMNSRATSKLTETHRTNLSRCYECTVELRLPADESGKAYRADSTNRVVTDESGIRTLFVTATYTAGGGNTARQNAEAAAGLTAVLTALFAELGGTWDATDSAEIEVDDENKVAVISTSYRELIFNQATGVLDNAATPLISYNLSIERRAARNYAGSGARPYTIATASFSSPVRKGQTQDLKALVTGTILPYLTTLVSAQLNASASYIVGSERWGVNPTRNTIEGEVSYTVAESNLLVADVRTTQDETTGDTFLPLADGSKFAKVRHVGPADRTRQVVIFTQEIGYTATRHARFVADALRKASAERFFLVRFRDVDAALEEETEAAGQGHRITEKATEMFFVYAELKGSGARRGGKNIASLGRTSVRS